MAAMETMLPKISGDGSVTTLKILSPRGKIAEASPSQRMVMEVCTYGGYVSNFQSYNYLFRFELLHTVDFRKLMYNLNLKLCC